MQRAACLHACLSRVPRPNRSRISAILHIHTAHGHGLLTRLSMKNEHMSGGNGLDPNDDILDVQAQ